jgi:hypothetical protein
LPAGEGRQHIGLWLWGQPSESLVVLDASLQEIAQITIETDAQPSPQRVKSVDIDHDESDELLYITGHSAQPVELDSAGRRLTRPAEPTPRRLLAIKPGSTEPLWQAEVPEPEEILGVQTAGGRTMVCVRARGAVYGLDAATGQPRWRCDEPSVQSDSPIARRAAAPLLLSFADERLPRFAFRLPAQMTACRQAVALMGHATAGNATLDDLAAAPRAAPTLASTRHDSRFDRPLPWKIADYRTRGLLSDVLGIVPFTLLLYVVPLACVGWLVRRRQWSLRAFLMLPAVALFLLVGLTWPTGDSQPLGRDTFERFARGLAGLPVVLPILLWLGWACTGQWRRLKRWAVALLAVTLALAIAGLAIDISHKDPLERYNWDGWNQILSIGLPVTGVILLATLAAAPFVRRIVGWWKHAGAPRNPSIQL